jgi:hypothetical protein
MCLRSKRMYSLPLSANICRCNAARSTFKVVDA